MYDPKVGRWLVEDPALFGAGDADLYRYVGNSPVNAVDPSGLRPDQSPPGPRRVADGPVTATAEGDKMTIAFSGRGAGEESFFYKVKQSMQIEVYPTFKYWSKDKQGRSCYEYYTPMLPAGRSLDPPNAEKHDHPHMSSVPTNPSLVIDHGNSTDGFSAGPYRREQDKAIYWDRPTTPQALLGMATIRTIEWQNGQRSMRGYELVNIRIVQRFITVVYLAPNKPIATVHWISVSDGAPSREPYDVGGIPETKVVSVAQGEKDARSVILGEWRTVPVNMPRDP
jgi:hypothetical protein